MFSKKTELSQLKSKSLNEIKAYKAEAEKRKAELIALKNNAKGKITDEQQEELDSIAMLLVDIDDIIDEKVKKNSFDYQVPVGEENLIHISIVNGRRFNPNTGKEESIPFVQKFTYGEFTVFKNNYKMLGYAVINVLHDPYDEAVELIKN